MTISVMDARTLGGCPVDPPRWVGPDGTFTITRVPAELGQVRRFRAWQYCPQCLAYDVRWFEPCGDLVTRTCRADGDHTWMEA